MNVELSERARRRVEQLVEEGAYSSAEAVVEAALEQLAPAEADLTSERVGELLDEGYTDIRAGLVHPRRQFWPRLEPSSQRRRPNPRDSEASRPQRQRPVRLAETRGVPVCARAGELIDAYESVLEDLRSHPDLGELWEDGRTRLLRRGGYRFYYVDEPDRVRIVRIIDPQDARTSP